MRPTSRGPLSGVKVLQIAGIGPTPYCGMMLSDMGADVIRIDRPGDAVGSPPGPPFSIIDRGRRSVLLDLKTDSGLAGALALVAVADVLIEGFRPGVMERLGLGPDVALIRNPRLVYGRMTGWGQSGPYAGMAGHDVNYVALTGALHLIGPAERPMMPLNLVGDYGGGGNLLTIGVLAALYHAQASGKGQVVDAAMVDGVSLLMAATYGARAAGQARDAREANVGNGASHYMQVYRCADGHFVTIAAYEPQFYALLLNILGFADDPMFRDQHDPAQWPFQRARMAELFATRTRREWCAILEQTDACFAPVLTMEEAPDHPHIKARATFVTVDDLPQPAPAPRFSATPSAIGRRSPAPGDGQQDALRDWGLDQRAFESWFREPDLSAAKR